MRLPALLLAVALCTACAGHHPAVTRTTPYNPLDCRPIPGNSGHKSLCLMLTANAGDVWFVAGDSAYAGNRLVEGLSLMGGGNPAASIGPFCISPDGSYLAAIVAEEGHPTLYLAPLKHLLERMSEGPDIPAIAVYPGTISLGTWLSDSELIVESDMDLVNYRHGGETGETRNYLVHLPEATISAVR